MQSKINAFFKPTSGSSSSSSSASASASNLVDPPPLLSEEDDELAIWETTQHVISNTYRRRSANSSETIAAKKPMSTLKKPVSDDSTSKKESTTINKNLKKKRSYAQFHLELGQSDFLLRTCSTCGAKYAPGDDSDEKNHNSFHKNYTHGVLFKGWRNERVAERPSVEEGRIVMVLEDDAPSHWNKVQEIVHMMEIDLGENWILHKHCKVYLFVSSGRITGCLVAEPVKEAFKLVEDKTSISSATTMKKTVFESTDIRFGNAVLRREVQKKCRSVDASYHGGGGTVVCEEEASPAVCGVRAIWVTPSNRRRGIASHLLDAMRKSFCEEIVLDKSLLAVSPPSSHGKTFFSSYFSTAAFLVYKADDSFC